MAAPPRPFRGPNSDPKRRVDVSKLEKLRAGIRGIYGATRCPDPGEGGCIGGPIPGHGCVNEAARNLLALLDEIDRAT